MTKDTLKSELFKFSDAVKKRTAEVNVMLVDQNNHRRQEYHGLMLKTKVEDIQAVVEKSFEYIEQELNGRTLDSYDLEISVDKSTQMVKKKDVIHGDEILDQLSIEYSKSNTVTESTDLSRIKFMVLQVYEGGKSLYLFKKYIQPTAAYKTTEKYILSGGVLKPFIDKVITISSMVDAFLLNDVYYVFNRNSFNSIFTYKDVFKKILEDNSKMIKDCGLMTDAAQFIADCESDGRYLTRLTKAILAKGFEEVAKKKDGISKIVKDFNLSLTISVSGEIAYKGKNDIPEILNLILRHYVVDALTSTKMIAAAIQEYQAGIKGGAPD